MNPTSLFFDIRWRRSWRLLLVCLLGVVSWFAFMPQTSHDVVAHLDKVRHLLAFSTLALVASLGWTPGRRTTLYVACGLMAYGLLIELVQTLLPTRSGSAADWLADGVGIAIGLLMFRALRRA